MSDIALNLADELARETIKLAEEMGDVNLVSEVAKVIGSSSQTSEEFFMTAVRVRLAIRRGHTFLDEKRAKAQAEGKLGQAVDLSAQKILDNPDEVQGGH